jgi:hypothetical protein
MYPSLRENKVHHLLKVFQLKIILFSILLIGCIYQTYYICYFYYNYPTIVSTETKFINNENELPAITFCEGFDLMSSRLNFNQSLNKIDVKTLIKQAFILNSDFSYDNNITEEVLKSIVIIIDSQYRCLTINPLIKGMIYSILLYISISSKSDSKHGPICTYFSSFDPSISGTKDSTDPKY